MEKVTEYSLFLSAGELQTSLNSVVQNNYYMMLTAQQGWSASIPQISGAPVGFIWRPLHLHVGNLEHLHVASVSGQGFLTAWQMGTKHEWPKRTMWKLPGPFR